MLPAGAIGTRLRPTRTYTTRRYDTIYDTHRRRMLVAVGVRRRRGLRDRKTRGGHQQLDHRSSVTHPIWLASSGGAESHRPQRSKRGTRVWRKWICVVCLRYGEPICRFAAAAAASHSPVVAVDRVNQTKTINVAAPGKAEACAHSVPRKDRRNDINVIRAFDRTDRTKVEILPGRRFVASFSSRAEY